MNGVIDVTAPPYKAPTDGTNDASAAINKAIADSQGGGIVFLPPGEYLLRDTIYFDHTGTNLKSGNGITLLGSGIAMRREMGATWLLVPGNNSGTFNCAINVDGLGGSVRNLSIYHDQPTFGKGWAPRDGEAAIQIKNDLVTIDNVFIYNATTGIETFAARFSLNRIIGSPDAYGILINAAADTIRVNDVHFGRFAGGSNQDVAAWRLKDGCAIELRGKIDNPLFSNIFAIGYAHGFYVPEKSRVSKFRMTNVDFDGCGYGIRIRGGGLGSGGMISNLSCKGDLSFSELGAGLQVDADAVEILVSNYWDATRAGPSIAITANGAGSRVGLNGVNIGAWDQIKKGYAAVTADGNSEGIILGNIAFFDPQGAVGPRTSGKVVGP